MRSAREELLQRVRTALLDVPQHGQPADGSIVRTYQRVAGLSHTELIEQFIERTVDYKATVHHISEADLPERIVQSCKAQHIRQLVVPADVPTTWLPNTPQMVIRQDHGLSYEELDAANGVLTGCALAIAQTGTIVLDAGARQGRRAITLIPDYHLCVVYTDQIVGIVPEAISHLAATVHSTGRPLTFISGPSATSDIELNRVEGVHGPRTLEVLVVESAGAA